MNSSRAVDRGRQERLGFEDLSHSRRSAEDPIDAALAAVYVSWFRHAPPASDVRKHTHDAAHESPLVHHDVLRDRRIAQHRGHQLIGAVSGLVAADRGDLVRCEGLGDLSRCLGEARHEMLVRVAHRLQDLEVDLAVRVDAEDPHGRGRVSIAGEHDRAGSDRDRIGRVGKHRPAVAVVVLSVQVSDKIDPRHNWTIVGSVDRQEGHNTAMRHA